MKKPLLSIIIPCYNEEKDIKEGIESLKKQSYKKFEIIIIDDGCTDKTVEIIRKYKGIKILKQNHKGYGAGVNLGAKKAKGDILILVDADMTFDKDYLKNLIKPILEDKTGEIIGTNHETEIVNNIENIWSRCWGRMRVQNKITKAKKSRIFRAIRKDKFLELGGFDPKYGYSDDQTLWFKYGLESIFTKDTVCYHKNPTSLKSVYRQSRWMSSSISSKWKEIPVVNLLIILFMIITSPLAIIYLSIKKTYKNKDWGIFFPWMIIFTSVRYFGIIKGTIDEVYLKKNVR